MVTLSVPAMTAYASEPSTFQNPIWYAQVLVRDPKVLTPLFYVSEPIGRSIRVQPAIRCDAINDDSGVLKNAQEKLDILGVETVDVIIDKGLDFPRGGSPRFLRASRTWQPRHSSNDRDEFASSHRLPTCEMIRHLRFITFPPRRQEANWSVHGAFGSKADETAPICDVCSPPEAAIGCRIMSTRP